MYAIVDGKNHLGWNAAPGDRDQRAAAGTGQLNAVGDQRLDARRRLHESDLEIDAFFLHVTALQGQRKNDHLKALRRQSDGHVGCECHGQLGS